MVALTDRQLEVLEAVLRRGGVKEAAAELRIASDTAKGHLASARERTGCVSTAQLVAWADDHVPGWRNRVAA